MKKLIFITIVIVFFLFFLAACGLIEFNYKRTIWINPDVECCGVKDPINNLEWLTEWYEDSYFNIVINYPTSQIIYLFSNDTTFEHFVVTKTFGNNYDNYFQIFTCDGELLDEGRYYNYDYDSDYVNIDILYSKKQMIMVPYCELCSDFFENHILIDTIAYLYVK